MSDLKSEFWERIAKCNSTMLGIEGEGRLVAMSPQLDDDLPGEIYFITAKGTDLAKGVADGAKDAKMVVANDDVGLYADIGGTLSKSDDSRALDEVWSFVADAWFEGGKADPDVCLLKFVPKEGELSVTPASGIRFLYEIAKANLTGEKPDQGEHGTITF